MRLDFSLLIVDDEPGTARTFIDKVRLHLEAEGFGLDARLLSSGEEIRGYLTEPKPVPPDIVLVDNRLGSAFGVNGDEWARRVRTVFPVTDIVFYGQIEVRTLREKVLNSGVDGVFCATRSDVASRAVEILDIHINRWTSPGAMRGLAVGLAADLDEHLRSAFIDVVARQERPVRDVVYGRMVKKAVSDREQRAKKFEQLAKSDNLAAIVRDATFGAENVLQALSHAAEVSPGSDPVAVKALAQGLREDVIGPRNLLAHGAYVPERGAFVSASVQKEWACTPETCREFRHALGRYRAVLSELARVAREQGVLVPPRPADDDEDE